MLAWFSTSNARSGRRGWYDPPPKRPRDLNQLAKFIVDVATGEVADEKMQPVNEAQRRGGLAGAKARANSLTLRVSPAMAAGVTDRLWEIGDIVALVEAADEKPGKRGPYRKNANITEDETP